MLEMKMKVGENKNDNRKEGGIIKSKQRLPEKKKTLVSIIHIVSIIFSFLNESLI